MTFRTFYFHLGLFGRMVYWLTQSGHWNIGLCEYSILILGILDSQC
jgi:hypothetical protein